MAWFIADEEFQTPTVSTNPKYISGVPPYAAQLIDVLGDTVSVGRSSAAPPAFVSLPTFPASLDKQDFLYDLYFRIWVFPPRLELRNPRVNVNIPFDIWNAYPYTNFLQSVDGTGLDGLSLYVIPPDEFRAVEYRTVNLQITPSAPLSIEAHFSFTFDLGSGLFTFLADRASVLDIIPDVPVNETWSWLSDVMVTTDGTEQRVGLRAVPRRKLDLTVIALGHDEIYKSIKQMLFDFGGQVVIPFYQYLTSVTAPSVAGDSDISFDPARTDMRPGEYILVRNPAMQQQLLKITVLGVGGATLDAPLDIDLPAGSLVAPAFTCVIDNKASMAREAVHTAAQLRLNATVSQARADHSRPGSAMAITTFDGYPVLDRRPLADTSPKDSFDTGQERFDYQVGSIEQIVRWQFTRTEGGREFLIHRHDNPAEMDYWRDFTDLIVGRLNPFLLPTYREDEYIQETPLDAYNSILIKGSDYATLMWPQAPYQRLVLWTANGPQYVAVVDAVATEEGHSLCTLADPMPSGAGYRNISFISYLLKVRLGSDDVKLEHYARETYLRLNVRTVPE